MPHATSGDVLLVGRYLKAVEALQAQGRRVVNVVTPGDLGRLRHVPRSDLVVVGDMTSPEDVLSGLAREGHRLDSFDAVLSMREFSVVCAGVLAELGRVCGMPVHTAVALRDKYVQKRLVRAAGLPTADSRVADRAADLLDEQEAAPSFPLVLKPLAGAGSRDTHLTHTAADLATLLPTLGTGPWLAEEFVPGRELHMDGIVREGRIVFFSVSRYLDNVIDIKHGGVVGSVALHPGAHAALHAEARELATGALAALGLRDGIFHLEAFEQPDGLVFSECGGRVGGGAVRECVKAGLGIDLLDEWARAVLDLPAGTPRQSAQSYGWIHLTGPADGPLRVPDRAELLARPGCADAGIDHRPGDGPLPEPSRSSNIRLGWALMTGADEDEVARRLREVFDWFRTACSSAPLVDA
ncbi:phosphoribosylaminoimidazole carboxylase (NCAIR synthetase) [Streptomyces sp. TLI_55]|uniref:ATP-grasp domain-containing protein n=1 Tax=Streptomyces sp. TLI_55 TaxID=1938861 RepID=UPI000BD2FE11|nr:ATP-grasp domain-containing protein [Streptomyces sp. TLI_55]SNX88547.1 phosphoribosylaminoimidazole carboxylase (NCAIR synthetase) [Streptomyces sp. TLI_55]